MKADIKESLDLYATIGQPTGGFLEAVLSNDLMGAMGRADEENRADLFEICGYVYNDIPAPCHGSPSKVREWLDCFAQRRREAP